MWFTFSLVEIVYLQGYTNISSKYLRSPRFSWNWSDFQALSLFAPQATSSSCNWTCQVFGWPDLGIIGDNCMYYPTHLQAKPGTNNLSCEAALLFWVFCLGSLWVHLCWVVQRCNDFRELQETWHNRPPEGIISIMSRYVFFTNHWQFTAFTPGFGSEIYAW